MATMDLIKLLTQQAIVQKLLVQLRQEREKLEKVIVRLESLARSGERGRRWPLAGMSANVKGRGRPIRDKNRHRELK